MTRIVLVQPEFDSNVGAVARVMKNFGFLELALVSPVAPVGFEARKFAKHSEEVLKGARRFPSLGPALEGTELVVGTTGVANRYSGQLKNTVLLPQLPALIAGRKRTAIVFGRESTGLSREELDLCDVVCVIPTSPMHHVLNLSHAVAIVLYELCRSSAGHGAGLKHLADERGKLGRRPASRANRQSLETLFTQMVHDTPSVRDPQKVSASLRNMVERSRASDDEVRSLMAALSPLGRLAAGKKKAAPKRRSP